MTTTASDRIAIAPTLLEQVKSFAYTTLNGTESYRS